MPGVTISASYGAGGSVIAPLVAERLGYQLLDRAMSATVAEQMQVTVAEAEKGELRKGILEKLFGAPLGGDPAAMAIGVTGLAVAPAGLDDSAQFRERSDALMVEALGKGAVILGRAGSAAFRDRADVLRVRLYGKPERRARQGASVEGVDLEVATRRLSEVDKTRTGYVRRLYGQDVNDPLMFQLQLDSTLLPLPTCADLIVAAYASLA
jgi:cytidylate kinase